MDVVKYPDPVLRRGGKAVTDFDADLAETAEAMFRTMYDQRGVGLAAPQVGIELNLVVFNSVGDRSNRDGEIVMVNPEIKARKGKEFAEEGCLSFPGLYADVERSTSVVVDYYDLQGLAQNTKFEGFEARVVQHELDHLRGVLFVDRLSSIEKLRVRSQLQEMEQRHREG